MSAVYTGWVTKRMVDIDDAKLDAARAALGTTTIKDTVDRALEQAVAARHERAQRAFDAMAKFDFGDLDRDAAWRR